ncbi:hypothetical protein [Ketobacter sp.]|uniref:hypothetical protein n=1 Tax=Ketobacter sp. TaxID=2083498 RepID=UPI000F1A2B67|nr:hypothetical protein [Ketobacter sp.]RLT92184.1 MAG: hypothetical protein D9N14_21960 [Ketobacter sp.]
MKYATATLVIATALATSISQAASVEEIREFSPQPGLEYKATLNDLVANPTLEEPDVIRFTSRGHYYKQALTSTKPRVISSEKFVTLPGSKSRVVIPAGKDALVNLSFSAESRCNEPGSAAPDWCEVRILVDGVEASPQASSFAPDTYAFDSTDGGTESDASWESHAMDRHHCVFNSDSKTSKAVPVEVQWKVTNFDGGPAPQFWLDDWSFTIQLADGCRQERLKVEE